MSMTKLEQAALVAFKKIVDDDKNSFYEIFKAGANWQKEQMMKNAKEITVECLDSRSFNYCITRLGLKRDDIVKIIIIKED